MECVAPKFEKAFQIHEIKKRVPAKIEPDIKNCVKMEEIWKILQDEYQRTVKVCAQAISTLLNLSYSSSARSDVDKFIEMYRKYREVRNDLQDIG